MCFYPKSTCGAYQRALIGFFNHTRRHTFLVQNFHILIWEILFFVMYFSICIRINTQIYTHLSSIKNTLDLIQKLIAKGMIFFCRILLLFLFFFLSSTFILINVFSVKHVSVQKSYVFWLLFSSKIVRMRRRYLEFKWDDDHYDMSAVGIYLWCLNYYFGDHETANSAKFVPT